MTTDLLELALFSPGDRVVIDRPDQDRVYATVIGPVDHTEPAYKVHRDGPWYQPVQDVLGAWLKPALAARDMVIGDLLNLQMLKEVIEVEFIGSLWTQGDSGPMTPYVCECSFGDGLQLLTISTINQRPNYHVVRVDSSWDRSNWSSDDNIGEHIDDILSAIEEECGRKHWHEDGRRDGRDNQGRFVGTDPWPALDDECGCSWGSIEWRWLLKAIGGCASDVLPKSWIERFHEREEARARAGA